jgi:hypothetical protein
MSGGTPIKGPWPTRTSEGEPLDVSVAQEEQSSWSDYALYEEEPPQPRRQLWKKFSLAILAIGWVTLFGWTQYVALDAQVPTVMQIANLVPIFVTPLVLIGLLWALIIRSSQAETDRITKTINDLRAEEARFGLIVDSFATKIEEGRQSIIEQNDRLMVLGYDAAQRLGQISDSVRTEVEGISRHSNALKASAAGARADMAVLLADLPKANVQTKQITIALQQAGVSAHEQTLALDEKLASVIVHSREAEALAGSAAQNLAVHLTHMESVNETTAAQMAEAAGNMTTAVDGALERAAEALATARQGMEAQGSAMLAMVEQGQAAMARTGAESAQAIESRLENISARSEALGQAFNEQDRISSEMLNRISADIAKIEDRISALGQGATQATNLASTAIISLQDRADSLSSSLDSGGKMTDAMISRTETLLTALDSTAREMDETLPAAFDRLKKQAQETEVTVRRVIPEFHAILAASETSLERLRDTDALLTAQQETIDRLASLATARLNDTRTATASLSEGLEALDAKASALSNTAGPQLIEALLRVKETANQAAEHARSAMSDIIPQSAALLGEQSREAMTAALTRQVEEQVSQITEITELAVAAAQKATDRLMRQMLTISETTEALEHRVSEAKEEVAKSDEGGFARRVSLLIESLNSTAIDVTKILSNEVTDTAWSAYLRGDRGVFTRRAVRLLDSGEVREVARHYDEDAEFREQVNRYIHDFEGMLRQVLATRDGGPLSVTLLSSDAGKLYVSLAQAIDRLRT